MAHLVRLIVALLLCTSAAQSVAQIAPVPTSQYSCNGPAFSTAEAALNYWIAYTGGSFYRLPGAIEFGTCNLTRVDNGQLVPATAGSVTTQNACPPNSTLSGSTCTCNSGFVQEGQTCVAPPNPCAAHNLLWSSQLGSVQLAKGTTSFCSGGCQVNVTGDALDDFYGAGADGVLYGWFPVGRTSSANIPGVCAPSTEPGAEVLPDKPTVPDAQRPPTGTCPGQVNGVTVYLPCLSSETKATKGTTETDAAGNTTTKTESKNTTCTAAGSCSTTVTTTTTVNSGASTTTSKTTTQGKGEFCAENPGSKECGDGDGSSFGGSCDAGFQCQGDAVQCALAKEVHTQNCKLNKVTDESTLYGVEKDLQGSQTEDLPGNETIPFGASSYDDSDAIGGAVCVSDLSVEVFAQSIILPLSGVCPYLVWIRNALLALGSLAWLLIVFRR